MSLIEMRQVTKAFFADRKKTRATVALSGVDLSVEQGEFVSLVGPSGCGKTVSLGMMAGFAAPTTGQVLFRGAPVEGPGPERGVVFQEYSLFPWMTVVQNVAFAVKNAAKACGRALDAREIDRRSREALEAVGLLACADARPNTLSGGMKQRVAIARLLAMDSDVFLMDEPFSALDEQTRGGLDASLFELWKDRRKTVVFVTHNISEAVAVSSRIVMFSASPGLIIKEWTIEPDLRRDPEAFWTQSLVKEIRSYLPASARVFAEDAAPVE